MGLNTLSAATDGQIIPAAHHNELVTSLLGDLVPRNPSRVPQDIIGQLGTSALRWLRAYVKEYYLGTAAQNLRIYEGAVGEIWIERNASNKELIKLKNGSIEVIVNNVLVCKFEQTTATIIDQYISYDAIKAKTKIAFANALSSFSGSFQNTFSTVFNSCKAGKRIKIFANLTLTTSISSTGSVRIRVNGTAIRTWSGVIPVSTTQKDLYLAVYTIPSDGNYTVDVQYSDCSVDSVSEVLAEEV